MQVFAVFGMTENGPQVFARAQTRYPQDHKRIDNTAFLVAIRGKTTQDVAADLGVDRSYGIVVAMDAYFGFHDRGIWEWISLKANS